MKKVKEYPDEKNTLSYAYAITREEWRKLKSIMNYEIISLIDNPEMKERMTVDKRIKEEDGNRIVTLTGTAYYMPRIGEAINEFYLNPIYQTTDRQIYTTPGHIISVGPGMNNTESRCNLKYEEEEKITLIDDTTIDKTVIDVTLYAAYEPVEIHMYQMSEDNKVIKVYTDKTITEAVWLDDGTAIELEDGQTFKVAPFPYGRSDSVRVAKFKLK